MLYGNHQTVPLKCRKKWIEKKIWKNERRNRIAHEKETPTKRLKTSTCVTHICYIGCGCVREGMVNFLRKTYKLQFFNVSHTYSEQRFNVRVLYPSTIYMDICAHISFNATPKNGLLREPRAMQGTEMRKHLCTDKRKLKIFVNHQLG